MIGAISAAASSTAVPPFSPADVGNLKAWYDASDTATITASGSAVTQWNDKSGNAYNVTQGTAGQRPVTGTRTQNGLNVIDFQSDDVLVAATAANWTFMHNSTGCTVFMAIYSDTDANYEWLFDTYGGSSSNIGIAAIRFDTTKLLTTTVQSGGPVVSTQSSGSLGDNTAKYFNSRFDNSNATAANRVLHQINAGVVVGTNVNTNTPSSSSPFHALYLGSYATSGDLGFNGNMCEVIIYSGIVSDANRTLLNSYLATKWGI